MIDEKGNTLTIISGDTELAELLQINVSRVRAWRKAGVLPYKRIGSRGIIYFKENVLKSLRDFASGDPAPEASSAPAASVTAGSAPAAE